jgi:alkylation response protein AidB-like acyl-CoA dehydrogenase
MDFAFDADQEEFRRSLRRFLTDKAGSAVVRAAASTDTGVDPGLWRQLAEQIGLPALHVPEEYGGAGASLLEAAIAMEELGRALTPVPYATGLFATQAILLLGSEAQKKELLPDIAAGEAVAALAISEPGVATGPTGVTLRATPRGADAVLTGTKSHVLHGHVADLLLVAAIDSDGSSPDDVSLFVVRTADGRVRVTRQDTFDLTRPVATLELDGVTATRLGAGEPGAAGFADVLDAARALLACEMVGGTERCLEMAVAYAKNREQFSRPIGSFQAVKHKCADMVVALDGARAAAYYAAMVAAQGGPELRTVAPLAKAEAGEAFAFAAGENIQVHGGIGFTWEHDAHLYFRRAKTDQLLFGSTAENRALLADRIGL